MHRFIGPNPCSRTLALALAMGLGGCASFGGADRSADGAAPAVASAAAAASAASAPDAKPAPGAPKPFHDVVKEAKRSDGFIPVWRKDDDLWFELSRERLGQPFLFSVAISDSVGERGLYAGQMLDGGMAEFRVVGKTVQLVLRNMGYRADRDPAAQRAVAQSFSDSLIASTPVASAPEPKTGAVLVPASMLLRDIAGYSTAIEAAFRMSYGLDRSDSSIERVRVDSKLTTLNARLHFATPRIPAPPVKPLPPDAPRPRPPQTLPDPRSFFVGVVYNLMALPAEPMALRPADPRLGHFTQSFSALDSDLVPNPRVHYVQRWRLEKKNPEAALSEPVAPITYWLDRNIPQRYRASVAAGILEWNKAFEAIGFKDAIVVRQQADDADFDTLDSQHASIRWFTGSDVGFARGPSVTDARSGEILDADIAMSDVFARGSRRSFAEDDPHRPAILPALQDDHRCAYAAGAATEIDFALDLLAARSDLPPDSPEVEALVQAYVKDTITHEVGHTLGLKHNFRASTTFTPGQLQDAAWTREHGISGSVMDYNAFNIPAAGERRGSEVNPTLGAYDYWAIAYAYTPLPVGGEAAALAAIAARSGEPALAYADDADAYGGLDPRDNTFDLGDDPLAWADKRLRLSRELWDRVQRRGLLAGDDPQRLRRSVLAGFRQLRRLPDIATKYIGGMYVERDLPGTSSRATWRPVEPARQRQALAFVTDSLLRPESFRFRPELLADLGTDFNEWDRAQPLSVPQAVLKLQERALDQLLDAGTARRLLDLPYYLGSDQRQGAISLDEVYVTLQSAIWSELAGGGDIDPLRRNLQREHLARLQAILVKGGAGLPPDAVSLTRLHARELQQSLGKAAARPGLAVQTRAHLQDSLGLLTEALRASMLRS